MRALPRLAQLYIWLLFGLALGAVAFSLRAVITEPISIPLVLGIGLTIAFLDLYPVRLFSLQKNNVVEVTISVAVKMAAILLLSPELAVLSVFVGTLLGEGMVRRVWYRYIFNLGMMTVECAIVAVLYNFLHDPNAQLLGSLQNIFALVVLGLSDFAVNSILVSLVIALATLSPIRYVWVQNYKPLVLHELSMLPIGVFIYILWMYTPWSVILAALPLFVMRHSYELIAELGRQTREALYALARVMDERDKNTSRHSELVAENAGLIAREMGLGPEQVDTIMLAAVMHDIGKIGMRNDILFKTGSLTQAERDEAKRHVVIGAELLEKFPLFEKGSLYVRHHHERWDGTGYPDGLSGEAIPLGARILSVADSYQAMTEKRPYRDALPQEVAFQQLREGAGSQFDPNVVAVFLQSKGANPVVNPDAPVYAAQDAVRVANSS